MPDRHPCDVCRTVHQGRCVPDDKRAVRLCLTLPGRVDRRLRDLVPWGDRSRWVTRLITDALDRQETT